MSTILNDRLKKAIRISLQDNKKDFELSSLELLDLSIENKEYHPMLFAELSKDCPVLFDEEYAKNVISKTAEFRNNPVFDDYFYFLLKGQELFNKDYDTKFNKEYLNILKESMEIFFSTAQNQERYRLLTKFNCFLDVVIDEDQVDDYISMNFNQVFNKEEWIEYYFTLISNFYPNFKFSKEKSNSTLRFLKQINADLFLGFEYDVKELKYQFNHGSIEVPELRCILVNKQFDKKNKYSRMDNKTIWTLNKLKHPFFYLRSTLSYIYASNTLVESKPGHFERKNLAMQEIQTDGKVKLYNSIEFGNFLQRNCYYELFMNSKFNLSYLEYIENSIVKA